MYQNLVHPGIPPAGHEISTGGTLLPGVRDFRLIDICDKTRTGRDLIFSQHVAAARLGRDNSYLINHSDAIYFQKLIVADAPSTTA
jgi:hypothetical protein